MNLSKNLSGGYIVCNFCKVGRFEDEILSFKASHAHNETYPVEFVAGPIFLSQYLASGYKDEDNPDLVPLKLGSRETVEKSSMPFGAPGMRRTLATHNEMVRRKRKSAE